MRKLSLIAISLLTLGLSACTNEQLYDTLSDWRRSTCTDVDQVDRARCLAEANKPYSEYEKDREPVTKSKY